MLQYGLDHNKNASCTHWLTLTLSLPRVINFKFPLQPHPKYTITRYEELGFSLLTQMKDKFILPFLTTSLVRFSFKGWENVLVNPFLDGVFSESESPAPADDEEEDEEKTEQKDDEEDGENAEDDGEDKDDEKQEEDEGDSEAKEGKEGDDGEKSSGNSEEQQQKPVKPEELPIDANHPEVRTSSIVTK